MTDATSGNKMAGLNIRDRRFLLAVVGGASGAAAYLSIAKKPGMDLLRARAPASRLLKRIRERADWPALLDEVDLGDLRIIRGLDAMLKATKDVFFDGKKVTVSDNTTRMRALELLCDLHGKRKADITLHRDVVQIVPAPKPEEQPPGADSDET